MGANRKTVFLTQKSLDVVGPPEIGSLSSRLNSILDRYDAIVRSAPELCAAEWEHILQAYNGIELLMDERPERWKVAWVEIRDTPAANDQVDPHALSERVRTMPVAHQIALVEIAQRWWADDDQDWIQALVRAGG